MSKHSFDLWETARSNTHYAKRWQDLPKQQSHLNHKFAISPDHSSIKLVRAGQHSVGSQNYHESPEALNKALLFVLARDGDEIIARAIEYLSQLEAKALVNCKTEVMAMQKMIDAAENANDSLETPE